MAKFKSLLAQFGIPIAAYVSPTPKMCTQIKGAWSEILYGKWKAFYTWAKVKWSTITQLVGLGGMGIMDPQAQSPSPSCQALIQGLSPR